MKSQEGRLLSVRRRVGTSSLAHYSLTIIVVYAGSLGRKWGKEVGEKQPYDASNLSGPSSCFRAFYTPEQASKPSTWESKDWAP